MSYKSKREIRSEALHYVGDARIGKLTGNGATYPRVCLKSTRPDREEGPLFEITKDGQTAFLISTVMV